MLTNDDWIEGFKLFLFISFVIGVLILYAHGMKVEHQNCIQHGGQWIHGIGSDGGVEYYCIEPTGY